PPAKNPAVTPTSNASNAPQGRNTADPTACESFERRATAMVAANPTTETATTARRSAKNRPVKARRRLISIPAVIGAWRANLEADIAPARTNGRCLDARVQAKFLKLGPDKPSVLATDTS